MVQEIGKFDISHRIEFLEKKLIDDMNNETFQELLDLKNYDLEFRIEELESKFSKDLSESTFNEIRELKKQKNIN